MLFISEHRRKNRNKNDRKVLLFKHGVFLGIPICIFFFFLNLKELNTMEMILDVMILIVLITTSLSLKKFKNTDRVLKIGLFFFSMALLILIAKGSGENSSLYWAFIIPPFYSYFLGKKAAKYWIILFILILTAILFIPKGPGFYSYELHNIYRLLIALVLVSIITFALELSRSTYEDYLANNNLRLKKSEYKRERLFDLANESIYIIDPETERILDCNTTACNSLGYTKEEILNLSISDIETIPKNQIHDIIGRINTKKGIRIESVHKKKSGETFHVEISSNLIEMEDEKFIQSFVRDISERKKIEAEKEDTIAQLKTALDEIKILQGILPICSFCKKIRDDEGYWQTIETYLQKHSGAEFSHGICNDCLDKYYPEIRNNRDLDKK